MIIREKLQNISKDIVEIMDYISDKDINLYNHVVDFGEFQGKCLGDILYDMRDEIKEISNEI